jgi:hypothetical protein
MVEAKGVSMMYFDYYDFETTPSEEMCVQVITGTDYLLSMRTEAFRMLKICQKKWSHILWRIKVNPHDFGEYLSLEAVVDPEDEIQVKEIELVENDWPKTWEEGERDGF